MSTVYRSYVSLREDALLDQDPCLLLSMCQSHACDLTVVKKKLTTTHPVAAFRNVEYADNWSMSSVCESIVWARKAELYNVNIPSDDPVCVDAIVTRSEWWSAWRCRQGNGGGGIVVGVYPKDLGIPAPNGNIVKQQQAATMASASNHIWNTGYLLELRVAKTGNSSRVRLLSQPFYFNGRKELVGSFAGLNGLKRYCLSSNCAEEINVTLATGYCTVGCPILGVDADAQPIG
ncbi:hypothetical protein Tco_0012635 [Tanacetum coccineum]